MSHGRRAGVFLVLVSAAFAPLAVIACKKPEQATPEGGGRRGRGGGGEGGIAFAVDLLQVEKKKLEYLVTAPGTLEAFERVQVTARVAGVVDKVAFREGQEVKRGQVLVTIDGERFQLAVNSAKAQVAKVDAAQKDVEAQVARREGASEKNPGLIPGEELATFRTKVLTAKADTSVAAEALKVAELNLRDSAVRAPLEGVIQTRTVETGQYVNAGFVMATLLKSDPMLLKFQIEPGEAPRLKPGMEVDFTLRETQRKFTAKINLVAGAADPATHMVGVTAQVDSSEGHTYWLRPGSFCDVSLDVNATRESPVIPRAATRATDHGYVVYVADENATVKEMPVTLGMNTKDGWVEIKNGLQGGEWLVVRGAEALTTGARVRGTRITSMDASAPRPEETEGGAGGAWAAGSGSAGRRGRGRDGGGGEGRGGEGREGREGRPKRGE
jgi:membrane fusion protein, multidrug efflux system